MYVLRTNLVDDHPFPECGLLNWSRATGGNAGTQLGHRLRGGSLLGHDER